LNNFPHYKELISSGLLPADHYAFGMPVDAPIIPALNYFLFLKNVTNFESKMNAFLTQPIMKKETNEGGRQWHSICGELRAIYLLGKILGLPIIGYDQNSPRSSRRSNNCDIVVEIDGEQVFVELKSKCSEVSQALPIILQKALDNLDPRYTLTAQLLKRDYDCNNLDSLIKKIKDHIADFHKWKKEGFHLSEDLPYPYGDEEIYINFFDKRQISPGSEYYEPDSIEDICNFLFESKKSTKTGELMVPMVQKAQKKGADYLICRIHGCDLFNEIVNECFDEVKLSRGLTYVSGDSRLGSLRGVILFAIQDKFCIINNSNAVIKNWIEV